MKILVADDSFSWKEYHKNLLEEIFIELGIDNYKIDTANWAKDAYDLIMQNINEPYRLIISDLQMEDDYRPDYAGEWLVKQIKTFKSYLNSKIIICSGCYNIKQIAETLNADYVPKRVAITDINSYKNIVINLLKY